MKLTNIFNYTTNFFLKKSVHNKFDVNSVSNRARIIHFIYLNILFIFAGFVVFLIRYFLISQQSLMMLILPIAVLLLSITNLSLLKLSGKLEPINSIFVALFNAMYHFRFFQANDYMLLAQFAFVILVTFLLKGNKWGVVSAILLSLTAFIILKTSLIFPVNSKMFYYSIVVIICISVPLYINNYFIEKLIKNSILAEKEMFSKKILKRLSHELLNPLNIANGYCELIAECENNQQIQEYQKIISSKLIVIEGFINKMNAYCDSNELPTLIEEKENSIYIDEYLNK